MKTRKFIAAAIALVYRPRIVQYGKVSSKENILVAEHMFNTVLKVPCEGVPEADIESLALIYARGELHKRFLTRLSAEPENYGFKDVEDWVVELKGVAVKPCVWTTEQEEVLE